MNESITPRGDGPGNAPLTTLPEGHDRRRTLGLGQLAKREEMRARWVGRPDGRRSHLRALLTELNATVAALDAKTPAAALDAVADAVRELAAVMDLGQEPELVPCGVCGRLGVLGASSCGFCWAPLRPGS